MEKETKALKKPEQKTEEKKMEKETKQKPGKKKEVEKVVKEMAVVNGFSMRASPKFSFAICKMIKNKSPQRAVEMLHEVTLKKRPVSMRGREVAHQKGEGISGARFPVNASKIFIDLVKQLSANSVVAGLEEPVIVKAIANKASEPFRREGRRGKRTHIYLEARDKNKLKKMKK